MLLPAPGNLGERLGQRVSIGHDGMPLAATPATQATPERDSTSSPNRLRAQRTR